jgi:hypothetical protein
MLFIGIDEAGYGPSLGPLCVGLSAFRLAEEKASANPPAHLPNFWMHLKPVVGRCGENAPLIVDDSKKVFAPRQVKTLERLRQTVGAFLGAIKKNATNEADGWRFLLDEADLAALETDPWGKGGSRKKQSQPIEVETRQKLWKAMSENGVELTALKVRLLTAAQFNLRLASVGGNKLKLAWSVMAELLTSILTQTMETENCFVFCDKLSGQKRYSSLLSMLFPGEYFWCLGENLENSSYKFCQSHSPERTLCVSFHKKADTVFLPTALASMSAKLVREEAMERLNAYFEGFMPKLKRTSGYQSPNDAPRFLKETASLRMKMGILDEKFIRNK